MHELMIFNNEEFGQIRTVEIEGKIYFVASDVARALGYSRPADAVTQHCRYTVKLDKDFPAPDSNLHPILCNRNAPANKSNNADPDQGGL